MVVSVEYLEKLRIVQRKRLKRIIGNLSLREGMGVIIRMVGQNKPERFLSGDLHDSMQQWDQIDARIK